MGDAHTATMAAVLAIAAEIPQDGFSWVEDGYKLLTIIDLINEDMAGRPIEERKATIFSALDFLDTWYGWDAPRMSEETERIFYRYLIDFRLRA